MPLRQGTRLGAYGAYEIVSLLGAGGMGEVYRARDHGLKHDVALKVLPDVAAGDADRRERFTREALAVAALTHPHIVTIHSVENEASSIVLIKELVEGRSLGEALPPTGVYLAANRRLRSARGAYRLAPGGRAVAFAVGGNLWVQALHGSAPRQLTRFADSRRIGHVAWSHDGTRLAIARGTVTNDIVLFTGLQ